ncbi:MAG: TldD/PmbA family protein [Deltaproteobacteria bacterium]|nr:TldD/PmbA family protein [Deltaproteobacteria bacterium]
MIPKEQIPKILKQALRHGGDFAELYLERGEHSSIVLEDNKIEKVVTGITRGAGLRLLHDHRTLYAYTNDLSLTSLMELAGRVSRALKGEGRDQTILLASRESAVQHPVRINPAGVETVHKVELVKSADAAARSVDPRIRQSTTVYGDSRKRILIANSIGELAEDDRVSLIGRVQVVAREEEVIQTGLESVGGAVGFELFEMESFDEVARRAARRALLMLNAAPAPGGRMPVVLSSQAGGTMIHEAVGHGLEADLAQQRLSVYSGRIGDTIASPAVTVVDDATLPNKRGSFRFDDEGTPAARTVLIDRGVLKGYLYDRLTAMKEGTVPTGNGRRESFRRRPIPRMTNTMILPGDEDPEEILRSTPTGLFVVRMGGGQVNTINGDFVFEVSEGYRIENGKVGEPVRGATLTGNGPEVLMKIDRVGSDSGDAIGTCGKDGQGVPVSDAQPTLRIPEITVGGEV